MDEGHYLVARITGRGDVLVDDETSVVITGADAALRVIREWLVAFERTS